MMPKIVGLAGKKQVGKDTVAKYLSLKYGYQKLAFGDFVKNEVKTMLKAVGIIYQEEDKEKFRWLLQRWGDFRKEQDPQYWIKKVFHEVQKYPRVVISDCRFINEIEEVKKRGGVVFKIIRNTNLKDSHPSEKEIDLYQNFDAIIENNGTIEELYQKIDLLCQKFHL